MQVTNAPITDVHCDEVPKPSIDVDTGNKNRKKPFGIDEEPTCDNAGSKKEVWPMLNLEGAGNATININMAK